MVIMTELKLSDGRIVLKSDYITAKTKDLREFGYTGLHESDVSEQVDKILKKETDLSVIGMFCEKDLIVD